MHPTLISQWKKQLKAGLPQVFADRRCRTEAADEELQNRLYQEIGQLKVELDWLKKPACSVKAKRGLIEPEYPQIRIARQCELLGLARS